MLKVHAIMELYKTADEEHELVR